LLSLAYFIDIKFAKLIRLVFFVSEYILLANNFYICSVADIAGTFKRPMKGLDGQQIHSIPAKNSSFVLLQHGKNPRLLRRGFL
jgi:hypothetical protein